jgi:hypothetical protein
MSTEIRKTTRVIWIWTQKTSLRSEVLLVCGKDERWCQPCRQLAIILCCCIPPERVIKRYKCLTLLQLITLSTIHAWQREYVFCSILRTITVGGLGQEICKSGRNSLILKPFNVESWYTTPRGYEPLTPGLRALLSRYQFARDLSMTFAASLLSNIHPFLLNVVIMALEGVFLA